MIPVRRRFLLRAPSLPNRRYPSLVATHPRRYPPSSLPTPSSLPSTAATHACPLHPPHWLPADWMDDTSFQRSSALPNSEPRPSDLQNPKYNLKGVHRAWRRADLSLGDNCTQIPVRTTRGTLLLLRHDTVHAGVAPPAPHPQPPLPSTVATLYRRYPQPSLPSTVATQARHLWWGRAGRWPSIASSASIAARPQVRDMAVKSRAPTSSTHP